MLTPDIHLTCHDPNHWPAHEAGSPPSDADARCASESAGFFLSEYVQSKVCCSRRRLLVMAMFLAPGVVCGYGLSSTIDATQRDAAGTEPPASLTEVIEGHHLTMPPSTNEGKPGGALVSIVSPLIFGSTATLLMSGMIATVEATPATDCPAVAVDAAPADPVEQP